LTNIGYAEKDRVREDVGKAKWFYVMADGSTDNSITEQENVYDM